MSIDFLRGLTIFTMILVNNPGSWSYQFSPLKHAPWHGWTVTDLVFPFFLFIVGLSISISQQNSALKQSLSLDFGKSVFIRFIKLMCLGWFLSLSYYNFYDPNFDWVEGRLYSLRWFGVLQRIAIVYLCCAFIHQYLSNILKVAICILLLFSYWTAMLLVELTDANGIVYQGNLLPGKNLAAYIDHHLFGLSHLYHKSSVPFASDPEGLLTTIPAIVSCLIGILVAEIILTKPSVTAQIKQLSLVGLSLFGLSYLLSIWIPFNKNLWTPSYVLLASGLAMLVLAASRWLIDLKTNKLWAAPFVVFGTNAIALFMLSGIAARILMMFKIEGKSIKPHLYSIIKTVSTNQEINSLVFAIIFLMIMYVPLFLMYKKKIFWKV